LMLQDLAVHDKTKTFYVHRTAVGSAFFVKGGFLITARHVVGESGGLSEKYLKADSKAAARKALTPWSQRIMLKDWKGTVVFDSAKRDHSVKEVAFSGHPAEAEGLDKEFEAIEPSAKGQLFDLIALKLEGIDTTDLEI